MNSTMNTLNGEEAIARGALAAGVSLVSGYPGSPSSEAFEALLFFAQDHGLDIEWSSNERVALEVAIGASIAGRRAMVCVKSVGMNVMLDTMMALNLTPVHGGLVILLGDDPGGYGSQNDQDTRSLSYMLEMPMMEPSTPREAYEMAQEAFRLSEAQNTTVIVRITRSFSQAVEDIEVPLATSSGTGLGYKHEVLRFVPVPKNVVAKHGELHATMKRLADWSEASDFNTISGFGTKGIIGAGFAYAKLMDAGGSTLPEHASLLKLSTLWPLPAAVIFEFLGSLEEVLILEEMEPFVETQVAAIAHRKKLDVRIHGSLDDWVSREGELFRWEIQNALSRYLPEFEPDVLYKKEEEAKERPIKKNNCENCRYGELLDILEEACSGVGQKPLFIADPGCFVTVADRLVAKYSIGSAVAVADGMVRSGIEEIPIAILGDSGFFHSSIPAICNASHHNRNVLIIVADNRTALASGRQPHPGLPIDALGQEALPLHIEEIARACGIHHIDTISIDAPREEILESMQTAIRTTGIRLVRILISSS